MTQTAIAIRDDMSLQQLGDILAKSGYFKDSQQAGQAIVKVLAGRELGFGPISSMTGINIIQGKIGIGANLIAAAVKRSGRYDYRVLTMSEKVCDIEFFEVINGKRESIGKSTFTAEDAAKAGTQNMGKFPRNMLFARAMSNGVKWFCPDVTGGPVYTPEELGERVNEDGEIIDAAPVKAGPISTPGGVVSAPIVSQPPAPTPLVKATAATFDLHRLNAAVDRLRAVDIAAINEANAPAIRADLLAYGEEFGIDFKPHAKNISDAIRIVVAALEELMTR